MRRRSRRPTRRPARRSTQSARELLAARLEQPAPPPPKEEHGAAASATAGGAGAIGDFLNSSAGKQLQREVVRGVFGMLKKSLQ